ncbi:MAG: metallophosphoesterase [Bdellovibrionales bacterium]|nr:metallophosphoesterase [Bdellovibrionales bacterium]
MTPATVQELTVPKVKSLLSDPLQPNLSKVRKQKEGRIEKFAPTSPKEFSSIHLPSITEIVEYVEAVRHDEKIKQKFVEAGLFGDSLANRPVPETRIFKLLDFFRRKDPTGIFDLREWGKFLSGDIPKHRLRSRKSGHSYNTKPLNNEERIKRVNIEKWIAKRAFCFAPGSIFNDFGMVVHVRFIPVQGLGKEWHGFIIRQDSDQHFQEGKRRPIQRAIAANKAVETTVDKLRKKIVSHSGASSLPDIVFNTGDLVTYHKGDLEPEALEVLAQTKANIGKFVCLGNHDYLENGALSLLNQLEAPGVDYQNLAHRICKLSGDQRDLVLIGLPDHLEDEPKAPREGMLNPEDVNILGMHNSDSLQADFPKLVDLMFCGHTHGGEVKLGPFDGASVGMYAWRYFDNLNKLIREHKTLTARTIAYNSSGSKEHFFRYGVPAAGPTLLVLVDPSLPLKK